MERAQLARVEVREPRPRRLDRRANRFQRVQHRLPRLRDRDRVRRQQDELGAARERLAERHALSDAARFGRPRDLADALF